MQDIQKPPVKRWGLRTMIAGAVLYVVSNLFIVIWRSGTPPTPLASTDGHPVDPWEQIKHQMNLSLPVEIAIALCLVGWVIIFIGVAIFVKRRESS